MRIYKIYGTGSASGNNVASVQFARSGRIRAIRWAVACDSVTDNSAFVGELSLLATAQTTVSDTLGSIDECRTYVNLGAAGSDHLQVNHITAPIDFSVGQGERLYLNTVVSGTLTYYAAIFIHVEER